VPRIRIGNEMLVPRYRQLYIDDCIRLYALLGVVQVRIRGLNARWVISPPPMAVNMCLYHGRTTRV